MHATATRLSLSLSLSFSLCLSLSLVLYGHVPACLYGYVDGRTRDPCSPLLAVYLYVHLCPLPSLSLSLSLFLPPSLPPSLPLSLSRGTSLLCAISLRAVPLSSCVRAPRLTRTPLMMTSHPRGESRVRVPPRFFNGPSFELLAGRANGLCLDHLRAR